MVRSGTLAPVARQAIPRFDLYAALGVDPSADDAAIEAAYWDLFGQFGGDAEASDDRRIVRARLAREWLTDPDRRSRYDASRARAATRAAAKTARAGAAGVAGASESADQMGEAAEEVDDDLAEDTIPWPAADLARQAAAERRAAAEAAERQAAAEAAEEQAALDRRAAEVEQSESSIRWSATPVVAAEPQRRTERAGRSERRQLRFVGWGAVIVAGIAAAFLIFSTLGSTDVANRETSTPPPAQTAPPASATAVPPTPEPSVQPTSPPATSAPPGIDTLVAQQTSWQVLQSVINAANDGDVETAQTFLGDTAPDLRASGLRRATFPDVTAQQMTITQDATGFVAMADETTRLTSSDGQTWTFDYGDRPLAAYLGGTTPHDLWWTEGSTKHHIYLRLSAVTVSKSGVNATAKWTFDPSLSDEATYFQRAALRISAMAGGDSQVFLPTTPMPMAGVTSLTISTAPAGGTVLDKIILTIEVTNPRAGGGNDRAIETDFALSVR